MLEDYLRRQQRQQQILLMTHIVIGYPSFEDSLHLVESMVEAGVDLMELQIPFSEPIADGPVILDANQRALGAGVTVARCLDFAARVTDRFDLPFLFMSYYNILFKYGVARFVETSAALGVRGAIVPDLPPEEGQEYLAAMRGRGLAAVFIYSPNTPSARLQRIAEQASGFVYCVARKGVTGSQTDFSDELSRYLARCRRATPLPLAVGFGVKSKADVDFLRGRAEIAVIGSETLRLVRREGVKAVGPFLRSLR
jgi:tryptophan synthase alpha chain